jgi:hypothetical protein
MLLLGSFPKRMITAGLKSRAASTSGTATTNSMSLRHFWSRMLTPP